MYFSKKLVNNFISEISKGDALYFVIILGCANYSQENLKNGIETIFSLYKKMSSSNSSVLRKYQGFIRRFQIKYSAVEKIYTPYIEVFLQINFDTFDIQSQNLIQYKINLIKDTILYDWSRAWYLITGGFDEVLFDFKIVNSKQEKIEILKELCSNKKIDNGFDTEISKVIKESCSSHHQLIGFHGTFNKILKKYRMKMKIN